MPETTPDALPGQPSPRPSTDLLEALLAGLLDDAGAAVAPGPEAVEAHRRLREGRDASRVGPLLVRVTALGGLLDALDAQPSSVPLDVALVADSGLVEAAEARAVLLDDDRVEVTGLRVALPPDGPLGESAILTLKSLDFALPAVVEVPVAPGWEQALAVLADDGAERAGLRAAGDDLAAQLVRAVEVGVRFSLVRPVTAVVTDDEGTGLLNAIAATAEAAGGGDVTRVAAALAERDVAGLLAIVASTGPRAVRDRLTSVAVADVAAVLRELRSLGVLDEEDTG